MTRERPNVFLLLTMLCALWLTALFAAGCLPEGDAEFTREGYRAAGLDQARVMVFENEVKVAVAVPIAGDAATSLVGLAESAELATAGATVQGLPVRWVRQDTPCTAEAGVKSANALVSAGVAAVVGPYCSAAAVPSQAIYDKAGLTTIAIASASQLVRPQRPEGPYVTFFRVSADNSIEARHVAQFVSRELGLKRAFIVHDNDAFGTDLGQQFAKSFAVYGGQVVGTPQGYAKGRTDFSAIIAQIREAKPDVIYQPGFISEAAPFLKQLRADPALKDIPYVGSETYSTPEFIRAAGSASEGAYVTLIGTRGEKFEAYRAALKAATGRDATTVNFGAQGYDSGTAILRALQEVAVKRADGKVEVDLRKLNLAIRRTSFEGASGMMGWTRNGNLQEEVVRILRVEKGGFVPQE